MLFEHCADLLKLKIRKSVRTEAKPEAIKGQNVTNRYHLTFPVDYIIDSIHLEPHIFMKSND